MSTQITPQNQARNIYTRALSQAWNNRRELFEPSVWLQRDPEVETKMLRDAHIRFALGYRSQLIAGVTWALVPRRPGDERSEVANTVCDALLNEMQGFASARQHFGMAFFQGAAYGTIHGRPMPMDLGDGKVRTWWVPHWIEAHDSKRFRRQPVHDDVGNIVGVKLQKWEVGGRVWNDLVGAERRRTIKHTYQDDEASLGYGRGLRDALGWWWYAKTHVFSETLQAVERFAQGILKTAIRGARDADTGQPNTEVVEAWTDVLEDLRSRHVLVHDDQDQVEFINPSGEGWQLMEGLRQELRDTISTLILGSNLPTTASSGGSYALADVQENSTEALIQFDREALEETLSEQLIRYCWFQNAANLRELGIYDIPPRFSLAQQKRLDPQERAQVAQVANAMGLPLAAEDVYEQIGFRKPDEGEELIPGRDPNLAAANFGPLGGP